MAQMSNPQQVYSRITVADLMQVRAIRKAADFSVSRRTIEEFSDFAGLLAHDVSDEQDAAVTPSSVFSMQFGQRRLSLARTARSPYLEKQGIVECRPGERPGQLDIVLGNHWKLSLGPV